MLGDVRSRNFVEASLGLTTAVELSAVVPRRKMGVSIVTASSLVSSASGSAFTCCLVAEFSTAAMREAAVAETALAAVWRLQVALGVLTVDLGVTMDAEAPLLMRGNMGDRDDVVVELLEGRISSFPEDGGGFAFV